MTPPISKAADFDPRALAELKRRSRQSVSVCIPARNEAETIGPIVTTIVADLVDGLGLVDEVLVLDDGSTDGTAFAASAAGARVVAVSSVLPELGPGRGKGNALWASLFAADGDLLCWVDGDLVGFTSSFVTGLLGPLLHDPAIGYVKGCYRRAYQGVAGEGGRVTELLARPVISALFPYLSHVVQPLGGEYAGRREQLEAVPFVEGWGVELGLLIDIAERFGVKTIGQVDLGARRHRNRPLSELGPQAAAILAIALRRAGLGAPDRGVHELVQFDADLEAVPVPIEVRERPPMCTVAAYLAKFGLSRRAQPDQVDGGGPGGASEAGNAATSA